jgi:hypothetical protein
MVTVCRLILQSGVPGIYFRRNRLLTLQPDNPAFSRFRSDDANRKF